MTSQPEPFDLANSLLAYQRKAATLDSLQGFAANLRPIIKADAVLLAYYPEKILITSAAPSDPIAQNLLISGATTLDTAYRERALQQKSNFRNQTVYLLAIPCEWQNKPAWLTAWTRADAGDLDLKFAAFQLSAKYLPGSAAEAPDHHFLSVLESLSLPHSRERLQKYAEIATLNLKGRRYLLAGKKWSGWKVLTSSSGTPDARGPLSHAAVLAAAALEEVDESKPLIFGTPDFDPTADPSEGAIGELSRILECPILAAVPMADFVLFIGGDSPFPEKALASLQTTAPLLPHLARTPGLITQIRDNWAAQPVNRRILLGGAVIVVVILFSWPFSQRLQAPCTLEPTLRRFVAAPFDSVLKKVHVATGDLVEANQLLVELDEREIRERISELQAQAAAANLQGASDLAAANFNESALSVLNAERAQHELELLRYRQNNLKVLSPIAGVVVEGDLERAEGAAMSLGRPILEVAPLEKMIAEVAIREEDIAYVQIGQPVETRFYALPSETFHSKIAKIHPRSETRDGRNVFIAEAEVENKASRLRPGMRGESIVVADPMPLFWILFRKPWNTVKSWFFW